MYINHTPILADVSDIIEKLRLQLWDNNIHLLQNVRDTPYNVMVCCPYHKGGQEKRPSAGISKLDGTFHCFACGEVHSLPELISYCLGYTDDIMGAEGFQWLLKNFVTVEVEVREDVVLDFSRNPVRFVKPSVSDEELDSYRVYHPYMWKRKLTPEVVGIFDIGYDSKTDCLTFPVRDVSGKTLFIARRSVKTKYFNYPSGVEKPVYGLYELSLLPKYPKEVIICESMIDALTCWSYGADAVALNGLGNDLQFKQLNEMPCRKFILATDNDDAGRRARKVLRDHLHNKIITELQLPEGKKDINDLTEDEFLSLKEFF